MIKLTKDEFNFFPPEERAEIMWWIKGIAERKINAHDAALASECVQRALRGFKGPLKCKVCNGSGMAMRLIDGREVNYACKH